MAQNPWMWLAISAVLAAAIAGWFRHRAWGSALEEWEHPGDPQPGKGWTPLLLVGAVFLVFALYTYVWYPTPLPPETKLWNVVAWLFGSVAGTAGGWQGGMKLASRTFHRLYPGSPKTLPPGE